MEISNGIIFIWTGTHASIPSGWSRVTDMDDKYPKGTANATNPNTTGGSATHSHTATASHTHSINDHTHVTTIGGGTGGGTGSGSYASANAVIQGHTHANVTSGGIASASVSSVTPTYSAISNDPLYHKVIFVTPTSVATVLPAGIVCLADATAPAGFNVCDGNNSTPNLVGKFLKGASAGADAGTTGGSTTNVHALSHTHTTSHGHSSTTSGNANAGWADKTGTSPYEIASYAHTHTTTLDASTPSTTDNISLTTSETVEPAYTKLLAIKSSSEIAIQRNIIALWRGLLSAIPTGWILCDGAGGTVDMRSRHLKITATVGEIGDTGGSNTHTHASQNHNHTVSHNHTGTSSGHSQSYLHKGSGITAATSATTHPLTADTKNFTTTDGASEADSANNEPPFLTVAFIKLLGEVYSQTASDDVDSNDLILKKPVKNIIEENDIEDTFSTIATLHRVYNDICSISDSIIYYFVYFKNVVDSLKITPYFYKKTQRTYALALSVSDSFKKKAIKICSSILTLTETYINTATIRDRMIVGRIFGIKDKKAKIIGNPNQDPKVWYKR